MLQGSAEVLLPTGEEVSVPDPDVAAVREGLLMGQRVGGHPQYGRSLAALDSLNARLQYLETQERAASELTRTARNLQLKLQEAERDREGQREEKQIARASAAANAELLRDAEAREAALIVERDEALARAIPPHWADIFAREAELREALTEFLEEFDVVEGQPPKYDFLRAALATPEE